MAEKKSPWFYVGIGCLGFAVLAVACFIGGSFWLYRGAKKLEAELKDPAAREAKVKSVLGAERLPDGYYPMVAFTVPFVMEVAMLSDEPAEDDGEPSGFGTRGLIYLNIVSIGQNEQELRDYFEGKTSDPGVLRDSNINIDTDEIITRGTLPLDDAELMYVAQRGSVSTQGYRTKGITSIIMVDCPADNRARMAIWFGPDPDPDRPANEIDVTGTPADEAEIARFMGSFRLCS